MNINYQYIEEGSVLFVKWEGDFDLNDYLKSIEILKAKVFWDEKVTIFMDLRQLTMRTEANIGINSIRTLKRINQIEKFPEFQLAYLALEPKIIASLQMYIEDEKKINRSIFSTVSAAKNYLSLTLSNQEIENLLKNLTEELI